MLVLSAARTVANRIRTLLYMPWAVIVPGLAVVLAVQIACGGTDWIVLCKFQLTLFVWEPFVFHISDTPVELSITFATSRRTNRITPYLQCIWIIDILIPTPSWRAYWIISDLHQWTMFIFPIHFLVPIATSRGIANRIWLYLGMPRSMIVPGLAVVLAVQIASGWTGWIVLLLVHSP